MMFNIYPKLFSMEYGATTFSFSLGGWSLGTWLDRTFKQVSKCILCVPSTFLTQVSSYIADRISDFAQI